MSYSLLPIFLSTVLHVNARFIGVVEGFAETTAAFLKLASGWWSDRLNRRKPLVVLGYSIAFSMRPLLALAQTANQVLGVRVVDRIGKGIRTSPRDALIADSVSPEHRGRAFGFHRAADNAGAVLGPLIAFALLQYTGSSLRTVFWWAVVPAVAALLVLIFGVKEKTQLDTITQATPKSEVTLERVFSKRFWACIATVFIFTLSNSTDAFLLLRANQLGVSAAAIPLLWALFNAVRVLFGTHSGALSDRIGRRPVMVAGWLWYAVVYFSFGMATESWHAWTLFAGYGLFYSLTEGVEKALIVDLVPSHRKGAALGWYYMAVGLASLPASLVFGAVWDKFGSPAAFSMSAVVALFATISIAIVAPAGK